MQLTCIVLRKCNAFALRPLSVRVGAWLVMDTSTTPNNGASETTPLVSRGSIADYVAFKAKVSKEVERLAAVRRAWASEESVALFTFVVDEYYAQLEDRAFDPTDLKEVFNRYVNQNAVSNRLADAKLIDRQEKGKRIAGSDLR
jgi:hypothetical protein